MSNRKKYSEHFINFIIKGNKFDYNVFRTREEFDLYREELEEFQAKTDTEVRQILSNYKKYL